MTLASGVALRARPVTTARVGATGASLLLSALLLLFFLSGATGLIYQVLWLRLLSLVFGVTLWAAGTVLASFMAGLALGSSVGGRLVDRAGRPLLWYGVAEVLVGLSAFATPTALAAVERAYVGLHPAFSAAPALLTAFRFLLAFAILLVPTSLMGATLPILIKSSLLQGGGLGSRIGLLYATNTAGAIVGTLLAGFYLIGGVGTSGSFTLAAATNVAIGVAAVVGDRWLGRDRREHSAAASEPGGSLSAVPRASDADNQTGGVAVGGRTRVTVLLVFFLSGVVSLALEVVWFRLLVLHVQVTTYAFTVMLASVLSGIALGSYAIAPLMTRRLNWVAVLAALELAIALSTLLSMAALTLTHHVPEWAEALVRRPLPLRGQIFSGVVASLLAIFPTSFLMGVAFPIGLRVWVLGGSHALPDERSRTGSRVGFFYSLNLCGAIAGSVIGSFALLPLLGSRGSIIVLAGLSLGAAFVLLATLPAAYRWLGAAGALAFLVLTAAIPDPFEAALTHRYPGDRLLWREEGLQTTVSVHEEPDGTRVLYLDGLHQADDQTQGIRVHGMIGILPLALHPQPREVLVIGLGGGVTAGAASAQSAVEVDVVELSESVARAADWFRHVNRDVVHRPNVRLRVDDGRNFLLLTPRQYDVITADIIRPHTAGAGNLYSRQYFEFARRALRDDGLMLQWLQPQQEAQHKLILRTFLTVFPDATLWSDGYYPSLLVAGKRPLEIRRSRLERVLADATSAEQLASHGIADEPAFLARFWAGPEELRSYVGPGAILTDDRPQIEYFLSLPRRGPVDNLAGIRGDVSRHVHP
jgi:spermidine synthase